MTKVYYNEIDPQAAAWLRELIHEGHIAFGDVDERSVEDISPADLAGYAQCHFFAGIGGWSYALRLAGWSDDKPVWTGSCPCQPFSAAGKGGGFTDERHLWPAWFHIIAQCKPTVIFGEQVASKAGLGWFDLVSADLEASNYAVGAVDTCAAGSGAPHIRQRLYWVAHSLRSRFEKREGGRSFQQGPMVASAWQAAVGDCTAIRGSDARWRPVEPGTFPLAHGVPGRVGRLRGYGNAIVPQVAATFIKAWLAS